MSVFLFGCELNIVDYSGTIDLSERMLKRLSYTVVSLHDLCLKPGTMEDNTFAVLTALKNPYVTILGHPDDGKFPLDYEGGRKAAKDKPPHDRAQQHLPDTRRFPHPRI